MQRMATPTRTGTSSCPPTRKLAPIASSTEEVVFTRRDNERLLSLAMADEAQLPQLVIESDTLMLFDDETLRKESVVAVTVPTSEVAPGTVNDPRMGITENGKHCATCHKDNLHCPGHIGRIDLLKRIIHPVYRPMVIKILSSVCNSCGGLFLSREELESMGILKFTGNERLKEIVNASKNLPCRHQHQEQGVKSCSKNPVYLPTRSKETKRIIYYQPAIGGKGSKRGKPSSKDERERTVEEIEAIFDSISQEDAELLGFENGSHPRRMILKSYPVIPPVTRPPSIREGEIFQDQLTLYYIDIVKKNNAIGDAGLDEKKRLEAVSNLISAIERLIDNSDAKNTSSNRKEVASIKTLIQGKKAIIRGALMGKSVNFAGRTVASPDPSLKFGQIRIPYAWAPFLTKSVTITNYNKAAMTKLLKMDPPRITAIIPVDGPVKGMRQQMTRKLAETLDLHIGDVVERWLQNGDRVIANRQPTLHKQSMMSYEVVLGAPLTVGMHLSATTPHNLDFKRKL